MTTPDPAAKIRAALDELEAAALAASNPPWTALTFYPTRSVVTNETEIDGGVIVQTPSKDDADAHHIALNDPAAVLRRVKADRAVLALHRPSGNAYCMGCWEAGGYDGAPIYPCPTVLAMASAYES